MSQVVIYQCDGPSCTRSDDESQDDAALMEAGWTILYLNQDEEDKVAYMCSFRCVADWALELVE